MEKPLQRESFWKVASASGTGLQKSFVLVERENTFSPQNLKINGSISEKKKSINYYVENQSLIEETNRINKSIQTG